MSKKKSVLELYVDYGACDMTRAKAKEVFHIENILITPILKINLDKFKSFDKLRFEEYYRKAKSENIQTRIHYCVESKEHIEAIKKITQSKFISF